MENAHFNNQQASGADGSDRAWGKVCVKMLPPGVVRGNVFHNNQGFGWCAASRPRLPRTLLPVNSLNGRNRYVNNGFPLRVKQQVASAGSEGGFVTDWSTCSPFDVRNGADNAAPYLVEDHVEYNHDFGPGAYDHGDVTFVNLKSAQNIKGLYWKTYRRGVSSGPLCDACDFWQTPELPGGDGLVEFRDTKFHNGAGVRINHHCNVNNLPTGGLCASHYLFSGEHAHPPQSIVSEADGQTSALVTFGGKTRFLAGANGANVAFDTSGCTPEGDWVACPDSYMLRTVKIYSPDRGSLMVSSDGVSNVSVPFRNRKLPEGPSSYGGSLVLPTCAGEPPTDCMNYMWPGVLPHHSPCETLSPVTAPQWEQLLHIRLMFVLPCY